MRLINSLWILSALVLIMTGCKRGNNITEFPVSGELLTSVQRNLPFAPYNYAVSLYVSGDAVIIDESFSTNYLYCVYSLSDSTVGYRAGSRGRGPGEFVSHPHILVPTPGDGTFEAYVSEDRRFKKFVFENERLVIMNENDTKMPKGFGANKLTRINDDTYVCLNNRENGNEFVLFNPNTGEYREVIQYPEFMVRQATAINMPVSWVSIKDKLAAKPDGSRFAAFYYHYKYFRIFDNKGNILKEVGVNIKPFTDHSSFSDSSQFVQAYDSAYATDKYIYALCRNVKSDSDNNGTELQVWNWEGEPVASYQLDKKVLFGYITTHDMKLYSYNFLDENHDEACLNIWDLSHIPH